jgi:uncharacterized membrane protein YjjP (DUF1212 family)
MTAEADEERMSGDRDHSTAFLLRLLRALHAYGAPAHRLEAVASDLAATLGLEGHVFSTPTAILASFTAPERGETALLRVEPGGVNLEKLARLDALIDRVTLGESTPRGAAIEVDAIVGSPERYGAVLTVACFGLSSAMVARYFDGGWRDVLVAGVVGVSTGLFMSAAGGRSGFARVADPLAALAAAVLASLAAAFVAPLSPTLAAIAGLIVLVPGFSITIAMTELGTRHLVSGTTRLAGATMGFLTLGFGLALGFGVMTRLIGVAPHAAAAPLPVWTLWVAVPITAFSLTVLFRAPPEAYGAILVVGAIAFAVARLAGAALGAELGMFLAAFAAGAAANLYARAFRQPAALPLVPAILFLVPGSLGLRSFTSLLDRQVEAGVELAFRLVLLAVALAAGLVFSTVAVPPRRSL